MLQINKDQSGSAVDVLVGESFEVQLPENPTTGFRWHLRSAGDPELEIQEDSYQPSADRLGAGGVKRWRFRAAREGTTNVEIDYGRSWEKTVADKFRLSIRIKPQ